MSCSAPQVYDTVVVTFKRFGCPPAYRLHRQGYLLVCGHRVVGGLWLAWGPLQDTGREIPDRLWLIGAGCKFPSRISTELQQKHHATRRRAATSQLRHFPPRFSFPSIHVRLLSNHVEVACRRHDNQAHRRSWSSKPEPPRRSGLGKQRYQVNGLLQGS